MLPGLGDNRPSTTQFGVSASGHILCGGIAAASLFSAVSDHAAAIISCIAFACEVADNYCSDYMFGGLVGHSKSTGSGCGQAVPTDPLYNFVGDQHMNTQQMMKAYAIVMGRVKDMVIGENLEHLYSVTDERMFKVAADLKICRMCTSWFNSEARTRSVFRCMMGVRRRTPK